MAASKPTSWLSMCLHILSHLVLIWGPWLAIWALSLLAPELSSRRLSPRVAVSGIQSLVGFGNLVGPLAHPVLYLQSRKPRRPYLNMFRREPAITQLD